MSSRKDIASIVTGHLLIVTVLIAGCSDDTVKPADPYVPPDHWPETRLLWSPAAAPQLAMDPAYFEATGDVREFTPEQRAETRWFSPKYRVHRRFLEPELQEDEGQETEQVLEMFLGVEWTYLWADYWGGIERGLGNEGIDITGFNILEVWINDFTVDPDQRRGRLHFDFGFLSEDFAWPDDGEGGIRIETYEDEDHNRDGIFTFEEDIGLDGYFGGDEYSADYNSDDDPFPYINNMARNHRHDHEDLDNDGSFETTEAYYSLVIDLAQTDAYVDVLDEYENVPDLVALGIAWRCYRLLLNEATLISPIPIGRMPDPEHITHLRIWYEDDLGGPATRRLQMARMNFISVDP